MTTTSTSRETDTATITVTLNGREIRLEPGVPEAIPSEAGAPTTVRDVPNSQVPSSSEPQTLEYLLDAFGFSPASSATAVNGTFVARNDRAGYILADGDTIEVLTARQGG
ncbi:MAG: sulfur carrier protein ThiS [Pseudomonadota bacterium]